MGLEGLTSAGVKQSWLMCCEARQIDASGDCIEKGKVVCGHSNEKEWGQATCARNNNGRAGNDGRGAFDWQAQKSDITA
ncbi:hypothetical protein PoB_001927300 [Plakobranchus ocellatus]|uniref:Uncharacterized protein n=1 Tax=Plakobranchus ocellatus TaxID=259542 RepID=A0AAV3ZE89_9GAST|nr:hypothetical protein PoB_001927300 [Plakobranchus ocellatus]